MKTKNLKLNQAIKQLPDDTIFKLGYKNGTNFLFIGTKKEFYYQHNDLDRTTKAMAEEAVRLNDERIDKTVKRIEKLMGDIQGCLSSIRTAHANNLLARKLVNVDLDDLDVKEIFDSIDIEEEPSKIIMVDGFVKGKYWVVSEAERDRKKIRKKMEAE